VEAGLEEEGETEEAAGVEATMEVAEELGEHRPAAWEESSAEAGLVEAVSEVEALASEGSVVGLGVDEAGTSDSRSELQPQSRRRLLP
jgi:hypothetical protein